MPFFTRPALGFDDVVRAGRGLSFVDAELCESDRAFSPFVDADSLLDLKVRRSPGILLVTRAKLSDLLSEDGNTPTSETKLFMLWKESFPIEVSEVDMDILIECTIQGRL